MVEYSSGWYLLMAHLVAAATRAFGSSRNWAKRGAIGDRRSAGDRCCADPLMILASPSFMDLFPRWLIMAERATGKIDGILRLGVPFSAA